jgi:CDP-diacylglycerol--glycerol-3-phosphate 3-phosphatidyltransferase
MRREFLTLPNILSLVRLFLVLPLLMVLLSSLPSSQLWGGLIILLGGLTDYFDGYLARKLHCESEWGRILDPLADKVGVGGLAVALVLLGSLPLWFLGALLARDLMILTGGLYLKRRFGIVLPSIFAGKLTVTVVAGTLFLLMVGVGGIPADVLLGVSALLLAVSFAMYLNRFFVELHSRAKADGIS